MTALKEPRVQSLSPTPAEPQTTERPHRLQLSATQLIASALAAVTATIAASYLGISGTVIGAAIASVITVSGNAVYSHSIRRTGERVRTAVPISGRWLPPEARPQDLAAIPVPVRPRRPGLRIWQQVSLATVVVFAAILAALTGAELALGTPLSDLLRGKHASGTTLLGSSSHAAAPTTPPTSVVTLTVTPSVVITTPTITQTAPAVTATTTPTVTSTATPTPTGTTVVSTPSSSPTP